MDKREALRQKASNLLTDIRKYKDNVERYQAITNNGVAQMAISAPVLALGVYRLVVFKPDILQHGSWMLWATLGIGFTTLLLKGARDFSRGLHGERLNHNSELAVDAQLRQVKMDEIDLLAG